MIKSYFKIAWRNLIKQQGLSFISVFGLSVGIACFSLCALYAIHEFTFDDFHKNATNIYRVYRTGGEFENNKDLTGSIFTPIPLGPAMKRDLPGVENYVRYLQPFEVFIKTGDEGKRENISFTDPSFFSVFSFKLKYGNASTALEGLNSIVLTVETAKRIFGEIKVIGRSFEIKVEDKFEPFTVTGIAENPPSNSSFQFSMLSNFNYFANTAFGKMSASRWGDQLPFLTYVQLKPESNLPSATKPFSDFRKKYFPDEGETTSTYKLQPLNKIHTDVHFLYNKVPPIDPLSIWILLSIAAGILLIACINFTTLAIGRSASRAKEVGVRKVIGGTKKTLIFQFLTESILLTVLATAVGLLLAQLLLPLFNNLSGRILHFSFKQFPQLSYMIAGVILVVGLLAGSYPSLMLSRFKPAEVLKTKIKLGGANFFTKSLVTIQFVISAGLIISAVIIIQQLHYMQSKYPGYNKENVLVVNALGVSGTKNIYSLFKQSLAFQPQITGISSAENGLGEGGGANMAVYDNNGKRLTIYQYYTDNDFIPVLGMQILTGRNFNESIAQDTVASVIINEALMNTLGFSPQNAVGQLLKGYGRDKDAPVVIGVVKNFNFQSISKIIEPQMFHQFTGYEPYRFFVRIRKGDPSQAIVAIQNVWKKAAPGYPLVYSFLDEDLDRFYKSEARLSNIVSWAGIISIFLACLGLLGLAALAVINRTKEIGIRKLLGASLSSILGLISRDFIRLIVLAFLIATPLAWYFMHRWLQDYAYRINIEWWVFAITGAAIVIIALFTVSFQAMKATNANPIKSLRTE